MAKRRQHDDEAWRNAKTVCRLTTRQVEMARALGMNPKKLPGLRPSPQQRWKLPVGEFIEECYRKRFDGNAKDKEVRQPKSGSGKLPKPHQDTHAPGTVRDPTSQAQDLRCYLTNLADDLERWLAQGSVAPELLQEMGQELREIAHALDTGSLVPQVPQIPIPPHKTSTRSARRDGVAESFDDDIPF